MSVFSGVVSEGKKRGRTLGYPTVNIAVSEGLISGVYVARVAIGDALLPAAAFADPSRGILEAYVLDASGEWYGKNISIELLEKIRESQKFANEEELKDAIMKDVAHVREYYKN